MNAARFTGGEIAIERVTLNTGGYAPWGRYFGRGEPLYRVSFAAHCDDGDLWIDERCMRAPSRSALRAELKRDFPTLKVAR